MSYGAVQGKFAKKIKVEKDKYKEVVECILDGGDCCECGECEASKEG